MPGRQTGLGDVGCLCRGAAEEGQWHVSSAVRGKRCLIGNALHASTRRRGLVKSLTRFHLLEAYVSWVCPVKHVRLIATTPLLLPGPAPQLFLQTYHFLACQLFCLLKISVVFLSVCKCAVRLYSMGSLRLTDVCGHVHVLQQSACMRGI